jgi:probable rRNA maturation factor
MLIIENQTALKVPKKRLKKITKHLTKKDVELVVCDNEYIRELNSEYRHIDKPTDVLSFPLVDEVGIKSLGTVVISEDFVRDGAFNFGHKKKDEISLLYIHGLLHLLGYDHEIDSGEMRELEANLIRYFELPESLILRTETIEDFEQ